MSWWIWVVVIWAVAIVLMLMALYIISWWNQHRERRIGNTLMGLEDDDDRTL